MPSTTVLIIGGTGAQGASVVRALASSDNNYDIKILARSASSQHAKEIVASSPKKNISIIEGNCFNDDDLRKAFQGIDACYVNTNGFVTGLKDEIYWGIRTYEIALWAGVKHFVYGGLDYCSKKAGFDPQYRCGHYDAKGQVQGKSSRYVSG
jgi:uncharacterized protein YbjT (DUF2867 family)